MRKSRLASQWDENLYDCPRCLPVEDNASKCRSFVSFELRQCKKNGDDAMRNKKGRNWRKDQMEGRVMGVQRDTITDEGSHVREKYVLGYEARRDYVRYGDSLLTNALSEILTLVSSIGVFVDRVPRYPVNVPKRKTEKTQRTAEEGKETEEEEEEEGEKEEEEEEKEEEEEEEENGKEEEEETNVNPAIRAQENL
ncbi:hypothetical protein WH47_01320 [Habropoda laboriosa]|uniref:Uncharacterized protein n=1 Tax=Habropoda laboriosa TaxID=597456 RepID=A0A0L7R2R6_9HYME|nr:hypothetical protein WH47_01320 [Habropoda laboriosa]